MKYFTLISVCYCFFFCSTKLPAFKKADTKVFFENYKLDSTKTKKTIFKTGAENFDVYLPFLKGKKVGIVTNQTGVLLSQEFKKNDKNLTDSSNKMLTISMESTVDFLVKKNISLLKIFAPEHGFRGTADAGELIKDGKDIKTGLPIISLYGNNKKPKPEQINDLDILIFDIQDVGARFYTYISTLHYVMEVCAESNKELLVFDRPNPNGNIVDGPVLEKEQTSFVGMHTIPVLHGMTIGEYAQMINGENWLKNKAKCNLKVVNCVGYNRNMPYCLPVKPSPNLPNSQAINLYASLCFFEGTNVSVGRGTENQFQIYGSPFLKNYNFQFTPKPNLGAKEPIHKDLLCFGEDLTKTEKLTKLELKWLINAYKNTVDKTKFFNDFFTKLAGNKKLQQQIEAGVLENDIRLSWQNDISEFKEMRKKYLLYH